MKKEGFQDRLAILRVTIWVCCAIGLIFAGCSTAPEINSPEQMPSYIREFKTFKLYGHIEKKDTKIDLTAGEYVSIMVDGEIRRWKNAPPADATYRTIAKWINGGWQTLFYHVHGGTFESLTSGSLSLGIIDNYHLDNSGHYDIIIIVWKTKDYSQISTFLEGLQKMNPEHRGIADALSQARELRDYDIAQAKASQQISATKEEIKKLEDSKQDLSGAAGQQNAAQVQELENRLEELTAKLKQLDEMTLQLQQEKEKSTQLSQELEEKSQREKELMSKIGEGAKVPPFVILTGPEDGRKLEVDSVRIRGAVEDDRGIMNLEILVNGQPVATDGVRGLITVSGDAPRRSNFDQAVPLNHGENRIKVRVTDTDGLVTEKVVSVHYTPSRRNVWAVVVGINDYPQLPKLKYAVNDARAFKRLLVEKNLVPAENITVLLNKQATLRKLRSALGTGLKGAADSDDMVIIFFAGHGATERDAMSLDGDGLEKYILTYDTDPSDLFSTALPMRDLALIFNRIRSERLIFIADACYSGASGGRTVSITGMRANIADTFLDRVAAGRGKVIITASAANEVSVERDELQHGVFTYYLLEGLKGPADTDGDGLVTVDEAYRYVSDRVPRATGQEQHPVKKGTVEGSLILSITR
ncbi:MAG: caspase family protein [Desulfobacterales bacterium]|nr:caspase family protein [Desulfobacterales bacterium]